MGKQLGFTDAQMRYGLVTPYIGNTYSGAALLGLANVLDHAHPGERIPYGRIRVGGRLDAFDLETTAAIATYDRSYGRPIQEYLDGGVEIPYAVYAKFRGKIHMGGT